MLEIDYRERLERLVNELDCGVQIPEEWADDYFAQSGVLPTAWNERRRFVRHAFRTKCILELVTSLPAIERNESLFVVYGRDVSRSGFAFLHVREMYPDEECRLWLPTQRVFLRVARCRRLNSRCFLVGARTIETEAAESPRRVEQIASSHDEE